MKKKMIEIAGIATVLTLSGCLNINPTEEVNPVLEPEELQFEVYNPDRSQNGKNDEQDDIELPQNDNGEQENDTDGADDAEFTIETPEVENEDGGQLKSVDSQLELISGYYDTIYDTYNEGVFMLDYSSLFAITDLNKNGRLELVLTECQGSGAFSTTVIYEVSQDYTTLEEMLNQENDTVDYLADFSLYDDFECYEKDGKYYYVVEDYNSVGWDWKGTFFYSYCFDGSISCEDIGGYLLYGEGIAEEDIRHVNLWDADLNCFATEDEYYAYMNSYWDGYNKQPSVKVSWQYFPKKEEFLEMLHASYGEYNENAPEKNTDYDYTYIFGDDYEYIIETE